jgi:hypothetical protein
MQYLERCRPRIHRGDQSIETQRLPFSSEQTAVKDPIKRPVSPHQLSGTLWPDPGRARQFVGRITAERNEVRHLFWIDAISLPDLSQGRCAQFRRPVTGRGSLCVARQAEKNPDRRSPPMLSRLCAPQRQRRRRESRRPGTLGLWRSQIRSRQLIRAGHSAARSDHRRTLARLIGGKQFVAFRRRLQAVPADNDRAGPASSTICSSCSKITSVSDVVDHTNLRKSALGTESAVAAALTFPCVRTSSASIAARLRCAQLAEPAVLLRSYQSSFRCGVEDYPTIP